MWIVVDQCYCSHPHCVLTVRPWRDSAKQIGIPDFKKKMIIIPWILIYTLLTMTTNLVLTFLQYNDKSITVLSINVASLRSIFNEIEIFINEVTLCCPPLSAICIQETWLNEHDDIILFNLNGHNCISQGKTCSQRGGFIIYLNGNFNYNIVKCPEISTLWECQVIEITSNMLSRKIILGNVCRLPRETSTDHKTFIDEFSPILAQLEQSHSDVIIAVAFNNNLLDIKTKDKVLTFYNYFTTIAFLPQITLPTRFSRRTGTLIDNFLCKLSDISLKSKSGILVDILLE